MKTIRMVSLKKGVSRKQKEQKPLKAKKKTDPAEKRAKKKLVRQQLTEEDDIYWSSFEAAPVEFIKWSVEKCLAKSRRTIRATMDSAKVESESLRKEIINQKRPDKIENYQKLMILADIDEWNWSKPENEVHNFLYSSEVSKDDQLRRWRLLQLLRLRAGVKTSLGDIYYYSSDCFLKNLGSIIYYTYPGKEDIELTHLERFNTTFVSWRPLLKMAENKYGSLKGAVGQTFYKAVTNGEPMTEIRLKKMAEKLGVPPEDLYEADYDGAAIRLTTNKILELGEQGVKDKYLACLPFVCAELCARYAKAFGTEDTIWEFDENSVDLEWNPVVTIDRRSHAKQMLDWPQGSLLELSVRTSTCLENHGIITVKDFLSTTEEQFKNILGKKSFCEVRDKFIELRLHFGMTESELECYDIEEASYKAYVRKEDWERLGVSNVIVDTLKLNKINNVAELLCITEKQLSSFKNIGQSRINEIKEKLKQYNLYLGMCLSTDCENTESKINPETNEENNKINADININQPIEKLGLNWNVNKVLWKANINTIKNLLSMTESQAKSLRGCGEKKFKEIKNRLDNFGLSFVEDNISILRNIKCKTNKNFIPNETIQKAEDVVCDAFFHRNADSSSCQQPGFYDSVDEKYMTEISKDIYKAKVPFPRG